MGATDDEPADGEEIDPSADRRHDGPPPTDPSILGPRDVPDRIRPEGERARASGEWPLVWHDGPEGPGAHR